MLLLFLFLYVCVPMCMSFFLAYDGVVHFTSLIPFSPCNNC